MQFPKNLKRLDLLMDVFSISAIIGGSLAILFLIFITFCLILSIVYVIWFADNPIALILLLFMIGQFLIYSGFPLTKVGSWLMDNTRIANKEPYGLPFSLAILYCLLFIQWLIWSQIIALVIYTLS